MLCLHKTGRLWQLGSAHRGGTETITQVQTNQMANLWGTESKACDCFPMQADETIRHRKFAQVGFQERQRQKRQKQNRQRQGKRDREVGSLACTLSFTRAMASPHVDSARTGMAAGSEVGFERAGLEAPLPGTRQPTEQVSV